MSDARISFEFAVRSDSENLESQRKGTHTKSGVKGIARAAMSKARTICFSGKLFRSLP